MAMLDWRKKMFPVPVESTTDRLLREAAENQIQKEYIEKMKMDQAHRLLQNQNVMAQYNGTQGYGAAGLYGGSYTIAANTVWSSTSYTSPPHDQNIQDACELMEIARTYVHNEDIDGAISVLDEVGRRLQRHKRKMTAKQPSQPAFTLDEIEQAKQFMEDIAAKRFVPEPEEADAKT